MPHGDPEAYMAQGMPPEQAMAMAGGPPQMGGPPMGPPPMGPPMGPPMPPAGGPMGGPPMDPMMGGAPQGDPMEMLFGAVQGKWDSQEATLAGEQGALMEILMMMAQAQPPEPQDMFAEGAPTNAGMMPGTDVMPMGDASLPDAGY